MNGNNPYPITHFDPLLRDLVRWDLVVKTGTTRRASWRLVDDAQRRLNQLMEASVPVAADRILYFDRLCADCHFRVQTRVRDGVHLCDPCFARRATGKTVDEPSRVTDKPKRHGGQNRHGLAGNKGVDAVVGEATA
jgi:hypothetical protein